MIVFVPREVKTHEYRVAIVPAGVRQLVEDGHTVLVEQEAGMGSGLSDSAYEQAGAVLVSTPEEGYAGAQLVVKVKEPQKSEIALLRPGQMVFGYFHFAASRELTDGVLQSRATSIAYETLQDEHGRLPLLTPMSEVAGRLSIQEGARHLLSPLGGRGVLLGGVPGVAPAHVTIIGAGVVGTEAARMAAGLGARVHLLDNDLQRLRQIPAELPANVTPLFSDASAIEAELEVADLIIGAVLVRGARAPRLIRREHLSRMKTGAVLVDVAVDQGGIAETTRPTTHENPTYVVDGVVHYGVANMPGAVARTSTRALSNATLPFVRILAGHPQLRSLIRADPRLKGAVSTHDGHLTDAAVAESFGMPVRELTDVL